MLGETVMHWKTYMVVPIVRTTKSRKNRILFLVGLPPSTILFWQIFKSLNLSSDLIFIGVVTIWISAGLGFWGLFGAKKFDKIGKMELSKSGVSVDLFTQSFKFNWQDLEEIHFCFLNSPDPNHRFFSVMQVERCFLAFTVNGQKHFYYFSMPIQEMALCSENLAKHLQSLGLSNLKTFNLYGKNTIPEEVRIVKKKYSIA